MSERLLWQAPRGVARRQAGVAPDAAAVALLDLATQARADINALDAAMAEPPGADWLWGGAVLTLVFGVGLAVGQAFGGGPR